MIIFRSPVHPSINLTDIYLTLKTEIEMGNEQVSYNLQRQSLVLLQKTYLLANRLKDLFNLPLVDLFTGK